MPPNPYQSPEESGSYAGMTPNERLFVAGLLDRFDEATAAKDHAALVEMLVSVDFPAEEVDRMADWIIQWATRPPQS